MRTQGPPRKRLPHRQMTRQPLIVGPVEAMDPSIEAGLDTHATRAAYECRGDGTRTRMAQGPPDFKSGASDQFRHPGAPSVSRLWQGQPMTHDTIVALAVLGVVGQVLGAVLILVGARGPRRRARPAACDPAGALGLRALGGVRRRRDRDRRQPLLLRDRALRPLRALLVPADLHVPALDPDAARCACHGDHRVARYLLPLPVVGAGVSVYHLLIENR